MKKELSVHKKALIFTVFSTALLFFSFAFNGFGTLPKDFFLYNYKDSESLVVNQVVCGGGVHNGQLLENISGSSRLTGTCETNNFRGYSSQYGLQGKLYSTAYKVFHAISSQGVEMFISIAQLGTAFLSALVLSLFGLWVWIKINKNAAVTTVLFIAISPMIVGFSRNLFWVMPMLFLPLIYVLFTFEYAMKNLKNLIIFSGGLSAILCFRYLMGYEYITTITIMVMAAASYYIFMAHGKLKNYLIYFSIIFGISMFSFFFSMFIHIESLNQQTGSFRESAKVVYSRAFERSVKSADYVNYAYDGMKNMESSVYVISDTYFHFDKLKENKSHTIATVVSLISYAILPVVNVPISLNQPFDIYAQSLVVFIVLLLAIYFNSTKIVQPKMLKSFQALYISTAVGLVGYLSWILFAHSHSLVHLHINGIIMYMPMALFGYVIFSLSIQEILHKYIMNRK